MKKLIFGGLCVLTIALGIFACKKQYTGKKNHTNEQTNSIQKVPPGWPFSINIDISFEPVRIARAISTPTKKGRICGCNECFGFCNAPLTSGNNAVIANIGFAQTSETTADIFFLDVFPTAYDDEFGIDEPVQIIANSASGPVVYNIKPGVYTPIIENGSAYCSATGDSRNYFVRIPVELE